MVSVTRQDTLDRGVPPVAVSATYVLNTAWDGGAIIAHPNCPDRSQDVTTEHCRVYRYSSLYTALPLFCKADRLQYSKYRQAVAVGTASALTGLVTSFAAHRAAETRHPQRSSLSAATRRGGVSCGVVTRGVTCDWSRIRLGYDWEHVRT